MLRTTPSPNRNKPYLEIDPSEGISYLLIMSKTKIITTNNKVIAVTMSEVITIAKPIEELQAAF
jgi:hypothetical protein